MVQYIGLSLSSLICLKTSAVTWWQSGLLIFSCPSAGFCGSREDLRWKLSVSLTAWHHSAPHFLYSNIMSSQASASWSPPPPFNLCSLHLHLSLPHLSPPLRARCETSPSSIMCIHTHLTRSKNKPLLVAVWELGGGGGGQTKGVTGGERREVKFNVQRRRRRRNRRKRLFYFWSLDYDEKGLRNSPRHDPTQPSAASNSNLSKDSHFVMYHPLQLTPLWKLKENREYLTTILAYIQYSTDDVIKTGTGNRRRK